MDEWTDKQQLDAWIDWKEKCDSQLCSDENKNFLLKKGTDKANYILYKYNVDEKIDYGFELFELHALNHFYQKEGHKYKGKSYKDAIFLDILNSNDPPLKILNAALKNYLPPVLRETFFISNKNWNQQKITNSITQELNEEGLSLEDIIPSAILTPLDEIASRDILDIATNDSAEILLLLKNEEVVLLAAQYKKLKRCDEFIIDYLETNTSHVTDALNDNIPKKINTYLEKYNDEDLSSIDYMHKTIFQILKKEAFLKISSDIKYKAILTYIESLNN